MGSIPSWTTLFYTLVDPIPSWTLHPRGPYTLVDPIPSWTTILYTLVPVCGCYCYCHYSVSARVTNCFWLLLPLLPWQGQPWLQLYREVNCHTLYSQLRSSCSLPPVWPPPQAMPLELAPQYLLHGYVALEAEYFSDRQQFGNTEAEEISR